MKSNNSHNIDWEIITSILDGSATTNDKNMFESWIEEDQNKEYFNEIERTWQQTGDISYCFNNETNNAWIKISKQTIKKKQNKVKVRKLIIKTAQIAAALIVLLFVAKYIFLPNKEVLTTQTDIINNYQLPDNSLVSINKNSKLTFVKGFRGNKRKVWLKGEAFFDVKKDITKPFLIHTSNGVFEVLGTSFNISNYKYDSEITLSVKTGKVKFTSPNKKYTIVKMGESIRYNSQTNKLVKTTKLDLNLLSWKTKKFLFDNTNLQNVVEILESVYNVKIKINDNQLRTLRFSASFDNQPLEKILKVIALTFDIETKQINNTIEIYIPK